MNVRTRSTTVKTLKHSKQIQDRNTFNRVTIMCPLKSKQNTPLTLKDDILDNQTLSHTTQN